MKVPEKELNKRFPVPMRSGETPVPIPNTMVKPWTAENTILETVWEDRWVPGALKTTADSWSKIEQAEEEKKKASGTANLKQPGRADEG